MVFKNFFIDGDYVRKVREEIQDRDLFDDDFLGVLCNSFDESYDDDIKLSRVFLKCYDCLWRVLYVVGEDDYDILRIFLVDHESTVILFRENLQELRNSGIGDSVVEERISKHLSSNREKIIDLIQLFFKISGEEE